jgi:ribosome-binding protein aMBF1 (putative translation factor)
MNGYDDEVKKLQSEAMADLQRIFAKSESKSGAKPDPIRAERKLFLIELTRARLRKKLSQARLAEKIDMRQSVISRIENGKGNPNLRTLLVIAKALDVSLMIEYKD